MTSQCAAQRDSFNCTTEGKSARLTNQSWPFATIIGKPQPSSSQREYSNATESEDTFSQLNMGSPLISRLKFGDTEFSPAGDDQSGAAEFGDELSTQDVMTSTNAAMAMLFIR